MIRIQETTRTLPFYPTSPLTRLPLLYHREHLFPYPSAGDTAAEATPRPFRMVVLENNLLRIEVAPELGGRVYRMLDKRTGRDVLFSNPVVKPVRILPVWAFLSGGIEFNFPIAHSPTSAAPVGCASGSSGSYGWIRVGEREARTGMEWAVELGLMDESPVLIQRTALRNASSHAHPWMLWTIAAVPSTPGTEFVHPPHRVLVHNDRLDELDWPGPGLNWERNLAQMTALFWKPGSADAFGVYDHDRESGLMHVAAAAELPGKKVWSYGHGRHRAWGQATTIDGLSYAEIESGPLIDQAKKDQFPPGHEKRYLEYWIPVSSRAACEPCPSPTLHPPPSSEPWLGWQHSAWQTDWERFAAGDGPLPASAVVTGIALETALRRAWQRDAAAAAEPLALWLAFHGRPEEALAVVASDVRPSARRLAGLILWRALDRTNEAVPSLEQGPLADPVARVELDTLYAQLGRHADRARLLASAPDHRHVVERRADLALVQHRPAETLRLLQSVAWPREHQRYVRTDLWRRAHEALGRDAGEPPDSLGEDNLAPFGAYWSEDPAPAPRTRPTRPANRFTTKSSTAPRKGP